MLLVNVYFFGAQAPVEDVNAENDMHLNEHLRVRFRDVFPTGIRSWWWSGGLRRFGRIWKPNGGDGLEEGQSSAEERRVLWMKIFYSVLESRLQDRNPFFKDDIQARLNVFPNLVGNVLWSVEIKVEIIL
ncbi:hypothetical protein ILYODFUR_016201 [Ilyodon furcidens]|uniref:Uncharacterized protein n=1 Tax=Ilyodon furcidens TaxID=33524 RepID=A0ABV0VH69_9TELE